MPLEDIASEAALQFAHANKRYRDWPRRDVKNRVEPIALPYFQPSFQLQPGEKIFTIGSCFARNVEIHLERLGMDVVVRRLLREQIVCEDDPGIRIQGEGGEVTGSPSIVNKYNPHSILNELRWALEPEKTPYPDPEGYFEMGPDSWADANMHSSPECTRDRTVRRRQILIDNTRALRECRVVVITPGLIESWWDCEAGYYLNQAPPIRYLKKHPTRFRMHVLSYDEIVDVYDEIYALLQRHLADDFKVVFTVSPVPLHFTFREMDVIVANAYSKSVLRAAAENFCLKHENVDYFPSFESFGCSNRMVAWADDLVHPTDVAVGVNVQRMVNAYTNAELDEYDPDQVTNMAEEQVNKALRDANREIEALRRQLQEVNPKEISRLKAHCDSQEALIEALQAQLKQSQDTVTHYLKQVLEKDAALQQVSGNSAIQG